MLWEERCEFMIFRKAVLIIHGFAGGVYDEESVQYYLNPNWQLDVYNFTLPGHERNLTHDVTYQEWINSVDKHVEYLINQGYKNIYVIGHSMGGVLALHAATRYPQIKKVVLAAPAFQYLTAQDNLIDKIDSLIKNGANIVKTYKAKEILSRILKVSIPMVIEFTKLVEESQNLPSQVNVPVLIFQGTSDDIVPSTSSEYVYNQLRGKKWLIYLSDVNHDVFNNKKQDMINKEIEKFFTKNFYKEDSIRKW